MAGRYQIRIEEEEIRRKTKAEWKLEIKEKITKRIEGILQNECKEKTKLRHIRDDIYEMKKYIEDGTSE